MRRDLHSIQRPGSAEMGQVTGADGLVYGRQGTRMKRSQADDFVAEGLPVVLYWYGGGQLEWFEGDDAYTVWSEVRQHLVMGTPVSKQLSKHVVWTAGLWTASDGNRLLFLTAHC